MANLGQKQSAHFSSKIQNLFSSEKFALGKEKQKKGKQGSFPSHSSIQKRENAHYIIIFITIFIIIYI